MDQRPFASGILSTFMALLASCSSPTPSVVGTSTPENPTSAPPEPTLAQPTSQPASDPYLYVQGVTVSTLAGDGYWGYRDAPGAQARFLGPEGVAIDGLGNIYIAERFGTRVRRVAPDGTVSTFAGAGMAGYLDGPASTAMFNFPYGVALDGVGNLYVADAFNHRIRVVHPGGVVSTLDGDGNVGDRDGPVAQAQFDRPLDVALSDSGVLYVAASGNNRVRAITPDGMVATVAGSGKRGFLDGPADQAQFNGLQYLAVDGDGNIYVSDDVSFELRGNHAIRRISPEGVVTTVAGFSAPSGLDVDAIGNLYVADEENQRIRIITPQDMVYTLAGKGTNGYSDGAGPQARFFFPHGLALDGQGHLYVAEMATSRIRVLNLPATLEVAPPAPTPDSYLGRDLIKIRFAMESGYGGMFSITTSNAVQLAVDEANASGGVNVGDTQYTFALVTAQDWEVPPDAGAQAAASALVDQGVVGVVGHSARTAWPARKSMGRPGW